MKQLFVLVFVSFSFLSCSQEKKSNKRPAYLFFKLGSSMGEINNEIRSLVNLGGLKPLGSNDYYWSNNLNGNNYYYAPIFYFHPGDTICSEMKIFFFDQLDNAQSNLVNTKENMAVMNLMCHGPIDRIESGKLRSKIVDEIVSEQGQYTSRDTIDFEDNLLELTKWKDKNDVDIIVRYRFNKDQWSRTLLTGHASLTVSYSYTDEMKKKLFKNTTSF